jgi:arsenate reductase
MMMQSSTRRRIWIETAAIETRPRPERLSNLYGGCRTAEFPLELRRDADCPEAQDMVTIYHNPRCTKSRETLALLEKKGVKPKIIEYLKTPPDTAELKRLLKMLGKSPREIMRAKEAKDVGLDKPSLSDDQLVAGMVKNPIVIERPIVVNGSRAALGRPPEAVLAVL